MQTELITIDPKLESLAQLMDNKFEVLGYRFGLNLVIDLIPGIGDLISTIIAFYILLMALQYKVSLFTLFRMVLNIGVYFIVGLIPWVGAAFGVWWKPNIRNLNLLRKKI